MADIVISQEEADRLIALEKRCKDETDYEFPEAGASLIIPLESSDRREEFTLDISRGRIKLSKVKYQTRARKAIVLVRLDLDGPKHQNPNREWISCPHLHLYRANFGDKWAFPVPAGVFRNTEDVWLSLEDFMRYCNIVEAPEIRRGLF